MRSATPTPDPWTKREGLLARFRKVKSEQGTLTRRLEAVDNELSDLQKQIATTNAEIQTNIKSTTPNNI